MTLFRGFTVAQWEIFSGNLLMFIAIAFYITWWTVCFRPGGSNNPADGGLFIAAAFFAGVAAITVLSYGIKSLAPTANSTPVMHILIGAAAFYIVLLVVTIIVFHRMVTSELLLIIVWAALELSTIAVLQESGRFGRGCALTLTAIVALATVTGVVCYVLHYRLDEPSRFWNGLIPLIVDEGAVAALLAALALF
jgi:hypothetical protein